MTTIENLSTRLSNDYLRDPNNRVRPVATKYREMNNAYRKIQSDLLFSVGEQETSGTISAVSGTQTYSFPTNGVIINALTLNGDGLTKITFDDWIGLGTLDNAKPYAYFIRENKINLVPTPDSSYTITAYYNQSLDTLSTSQDTEYPSDYDEVILSYASFLLFSKVNKLDSAKTMKYIYEEAINTLRMKYFYQDDSTSMNM